MNFNYLSMKKIILTLALVAGIISAVNAQVDGKAIGLRFGGSYSGNYGAEISYQQALGSANRLELDLGANSWGLGVTGIYQWVWDLSALSDGFNWYAGVGANAGLWNSNSGFSGITLGLAGQVGAEYNFNIPLQLSLDYRPIIPLFNGHGYSDGIALGVRYKF